MRWGLSSGSGRAIGAARKRPGLRKPCCGCLFSRSRRQVCGAGGRTCGASQAHRQAGCAAGDAIGWDRSEDRLAVVRSIRAGIVAGAGYEATGLRMSGWPRGRSQRSCWRADRRRAGWCTGGASVGGASGEEAEDKLLAGGWRAPCRSRPRIASSFVQAGRVVAGLSRVGMWWAKVLVARLAGGIGPGLLNLGTDQLRWGGAGRRRRVSVLLQTLLGLALVFFRCLSRPTYPHAEAD